jgi:antirestriction protein ArdC
MASQLQIRQEITDRILEALTSGRLLSWRKPWNADGNCGSPCNVVTKKAYTGINPLLLEVAASRHGFSSTWWATFRQWTELGGTVMRRPAKRSAGSLGDSHRVLHARRQKQVDEDGEEVDEKFFLLRSYTVFNLDQVHGEHLDHLRGTAFQDSTRRRFLGGPGMLLAVR